MEKLCDMVNQLLQSNKALWLKLRNMEDTLSRKSTGPSAPSDNEMQSNSGADDAAQPDSESTEPDALSKAVSNCSGGKVDTLSTKQADLGSNHGKVSALEELLHGSRVYRHAAGQHSESSLVHHGRSSLAISIWSSMKLGEVSNVSVYALPVYANELSNPDCYEFERFRQPLQQLSSNELSESDVLITQYQSLFTELPPLRRQLLLYIIDLLAVFASKSDLNFMTTAKLAALFQPALLSLPYHRLQLEQLRMNQDVLTFLIDNVDGFLVGVQNEKQ